MKIILSIFLISICFISFGQNEYTVNGFKLSEIPAEYVEIVGANKSIFKPFQVTIYVDYGQIGKMKDISKGRVLAWDGTQATFNGMMGVVNEFSKSGWELDQTILLSQPSGGSVYHYIFKKN